MAQDEKYMCCTVCVRDTCTSGPRQVLLRCFAGYGLGYGIGYGLGYGTCAAEKKQRTTQASS
jgi:hypothetical protein